MRIRCPHCQHPVEVVDESSFRELVCPSCGSDFSLVGNDETATYSGPTKRSIGPFELTERLGTGAFGAVWKARDTRLDRWVAVKLPRKEQLTEAEAEQFIREARAAAQLRHPLIVGVHEVGRSAGSIYIVSDYIQGVTLADWLTARRPTWRIAAQLCVHVARALHAAHEAGVVHRDLKPSNIMLDDQDQPHVMDFGLAKREAGEVTMTVDGQVLGTPAYMSPEQARGDAHRADRRTDIYSLGVILFELLTHERPFRGNARMLLHQVINDEPPSLRSLNSSVPRDLETICLRCLEKDPLRRFANAEELAGELERLLRGEPIRSRPVGSLERTWRWCRRRPAIAGLATLLFVSLVAGTAVSTFFAIDANQKNHDLLREQRRADREERSAATSRQAASDAQREADKKIEQVLRVMDVGTAPKITDRFGQVVEDYVGLTFESGGLACDLSQLHEEGLTVVSLSKVLLLTMATAARHTSAPQAGADIVVVVEEAGSMAFTHRYLQDFIPRLDEGLLSLGIGGAATPNLYGLVGFGGAPGTPHELGHSHALGVDGRLTGSANELVAALRELQADGAVEDGYDALCFALRTYPWRPNTAHVVILMTDEDRDVLDPVSSIASVRELLAEKRVVLHGLYSIAIDDGQGNRALALTGTGAAFLADGQGGFAVRKDGRLELDSLAGAALATGARRLAPRPSAATPAVAEAWRVDREQGDARRRAKLWRRAIDDYTRALEGGADDPQILVDRADCWSQLRQWDDAESDYGEALRRSPGLQEALRGRGALHAGLANWRAAAEDFAEVLRAEGGDREAWRQLARCEQALGGLVAKPPPPESRSIPDEYPPLPAKIAELFTAGDGLVEAEFAVAPAASWDALRDACDALRSSGYRPLRLRPVRGTSPLLVAACFTRDGLPWDLTTCSLDALGALEAERRAAGWSPCDLSISESTSVPTASEAWVVWVKSPGFPDWRLWTGLPFDEYRARTAPVQALLKFQPIAQQHGGAQGSLWSGCWARGSDRVWKTLSGGRERMLAAFDASGGWAPADLHVGLNHNAEATRVLVERSRAGIEAAGSEASVELGRLLFFLRHDDEAIPVLTSVVERQPSFLAYGYRSLARVRAEDPRAAEDLRLLRPLGADTTTVTCFNAAFAALQGKFDPLKAMEAPRSPYPQPTAAQWALEAEAFLIGASARGVSEPQRAPWRQQALRRLAEAIKRGLSTSSLPDDPGFDVVREDAAFIQLLRQHEPRIAFDMLLIDDPEVVGHAPFDLDRAEHLERMRALAAAGYRPISITAAQLTAEQAQATPWRGPWTVSSGWIRPLPAPTERPNAPPHDK